MRVWRGEKIEGRGLRGEDFGQQRWRLGNSGHFPSLVGGGWSEFEFLAKSPRRKGEYKAHIFHAGGRFPLDENEHIYFCSL
jgi:hypothetical protein